MATPDDKMDDPIENVLYWAAQLIERVRTMPSFTEDDLALLDAGEFFRVEDELRHAYNVVLRTRAHEVCGELSRVGLTGCTVATVRDDPFAIALIYARHCGFAE